MTAPRVDILLATYNNERYIDAQLNSLQVQTHANWRILTRDDGSNDGTVDRLREFASANPGRVVFIEDDLGNLGPCQNFSRLLAKSDAPYMMFCDADDVWLPEKIAKTLAAMQRAESDARHDHPVLVHTDLRVVNDQLEPIAESFWQFQNLRPADTDLHQLLMQDNITGCTVMVNAALQRLAVPVPPQAAMHDHWLGLVASAFGTIIRLKEPQILYRQHGGNALGASGWGPRTILQRLAKGMEPIRQSYRRTTEQARAFYDQYGAQLSPADAALVQALADLPNQGFFQRRRTAFRYRLFKTGLLRNLVYLLTI